MPIAILSVHVANKIAAGEVVERPASVVKELVENALDAAATRIEVEIVAGGRKLVSVSDNGTGMSRDDALLAIERQATSKIRDVDDIERVQTLGFRGEALPSIAAVCRFRLATCAAGQTAGSELRMAGGKLQDVREFGTPQGTLVEVRDLFFNVPARRKFLRTVQTEQTRIRMLFAGLAISHPTVAFRLKADGRELWQLPAGTLQDRLRDLFGADRLRDLKKVDYRRDPVLSGFVGIPAAARSDRAEQYVFINGRVAQSPGVAYALNEAYRGLLPSGKYAPLFLFIEIDPEKVDVNVHPAKREVRFRQPGPVRDAVIAAVRQALGHPSGSSAPGVAPAAPAAASAAGAARIALRQGFLGNFPGLRSPAYPEPPATRPAVGGAPPAASQSVEAGAPPTEGSEGNAPWAWCRVVGRIGPLYAVLETEDGYAVLDPHAAHERIQFERFMRSFLDGQVQSQPLLLPETVELAPADALRVRRNLALLREMGFGVAEFGGDTFVADALPSCFSGAAAGAMLGEIARHLEEAGARGGKGRWREEAIAQAACKSAVKARDALSNRELESLVADLARAEMPYTCPHGRPTLIFTSFQELNRKFARE